MAFWPLAPNLKRSCNIHSINKRQLDLPCLLNDNAWMDSIFGQALSSGLLLLHHKIFFSLEQEAKSPPHRKPRIRLPMPNEYLSTIFGADSKCLVQLSYQHNSVQKMHSHAAVKRLATSKKKVITMARDRN